METAKFGYNDQEDFGYEDEYADEEFYDPEDINLRHRIRRREHRKRQEFIAFYSLLLGLLSGLIVFLSFLAHNKISKK